MALLGVIACLAVSWPVLGAEAPLPFAKDLHSHGVTQDQLESLAEIMRQAVEQEQIAGGSFLVAHKGEVVFREAFGYADIESKRPFTTDELLPIASVSKPFLASVLMVLVEQGKLKLDDPVAKYLPEFKGKRVEGSQSPARPMTIRHLLSHTAGFWGNKRITPEKMDLIRNFERPLAEAVNWHCGVRSRVRAGNEMDLLRYRILRGGSCRGSRSWPVARGDCAGRLVSPPGSESHDLFALERSTKDGAHGVSETRREAAETTFHGGDRISASSCRGDRCSQRWTRWLCSVRCI